MSTRGRGPETMAAEAEHQEMLIVTGMSGAGRSTVGNALEDLGWYVVDNLPPQMLRPLVELVERAGASLPAHRGGRRRARPRLLLRAAGHHPGAAHRRERARRLPRRDRCGARAPIRVGAPPAPAAGQRHAARRHRRGARPPRRAARVQRHRRRHLRPEHPPARDAHHRDRSPRPGEPACASRC